MEKKEGRTEKLAYYLNHKRRTSAIQRFENDKKKNKTVYRSLLKMYKKKNISNLFINSLICMYLGDQVG